MGMHDDQHTTIRPTTPYETSSLTPKEHTKSPTVYQNRLPDLPVQNTVTPVNVTIQAGPHQADVDTNQTEQTPAEETDKTGTHENEPQPTLAVNSLN